jgi:hypothetical protein
VGKGSCSSLSTSAAAAAAAAAKELCIDPAADAVTLLFDRSAGWIERMLL